jgi:hypothetical protein
MLTRWLIGAAFAATSAAINAQTYDLDITMTGLGKSPVTFSGSFSFDAGGTGFCSEAFCGPGITPQFSSVLISDPLSIDQPRGAFAFTDTAGGYGTVTLFDTYAGSPGQSSFVYQLAFTLEGPLGGPAASIGLSNVYFATDDNVTGMYSCGGPARTATPGISCTQATLTVEPSFAAKSAAEEGPAKGVPEPGTLSLLAIAIVGIAVARPRGVRTPTRLAFLVPRARRAASARSCSDRPRGSPR